MQPVSANATARAIAARNSGEPFDPNRLHQAEVEGFAHGEWMGRSFESLLNEGSDVQRRSFLENTVQVAEMLKEEIGTKAKQRAQMGEAPTESAAFAGAAKDRLIPYLNELHKRMMAEAGP